MLLPLSNKGRWSGLGPMVAAMLLTGPLHIADWHRQHGNAEVTGKTRNKAADSNALPTITLEETIF